MAYKTYSLSSPACTVPDCRRARCGKSLARTLDLVNSKPTTPGVDGEAAAEDANVESVAAARRADRKVMVPKAMAQDMTVDYAGLLRDGEQNTQHEPVYLVVTDGKPLQGKLAFLYDASDDDTAGN